MKKKLVMFGMAIVLLSLAACGNNNSSKKDDASSIASSQTQVSSDKKADSMSSELSSLKKEKRKLQESKKQTNKSIGTLTVQQMKKHPKQSAVAITYYGAEHFWNGIADKVSDGFNVSIKTTNSSTVKYYIQKGDSPYYRLLGDTHDTVVYYDNADKELQKVNMSTIVTDVNQKLTDNDRTSIVNNVAIEVSKSNDGQKSNENSDASGQTLSINETMKLINKFERSNGNSQFNMTIKAGTTKEVTFDEFARGGYEPYGAGGWQIGMIYSVGGLREYYYMVPNHNNTTVSLKTVSWQSTDIDKKDTENYTINR